MTGRRVLMVLTSHDEMGVSGRKTGNWFDEVATPYYRFTEAGFAVTLASARGGAAPLDPASRRAPYATDATRRFEGDAAAVEALARTMPFAAVDPAAYDAVFFPGGYGQLWDLASDSAVIQAVEQWVAGETPVAMVCHAPAILRDARRADGEPLVKGRAVTGFTDAEDAELGLTRAVLFSVERALRGNGAVFQHAARNWAPNVVQDGALLTGQNPASAAALADAMVERLRATAGAELARVSGSAGSR